MAIKEGDLEGLIFTGANDRGVEIMQAYLDRTSDIQTVASVVGRCIMGGEGGGKREEWMEGYREWLNKGRLWKVREGRRLGEFGEKSCSSLDATNPLPHFTHHSSVPSLTSQGPPSSAQATTFPLPTVPVKSLQL